jgi:hypothetical protein
MPDALDFDFVLNTSARAFVEMRYAYEPSAEPRWMASMVTTAVHQRILDLRPDLEKLNYQTTSTTDARGIKFTTGRVTKR